MKNNYPQDDDNTIYLEDNGGFSLAVIIEKVNEKWPGVNFDNVIIETEYRHVTGIGYDLYDSTDYQNYIVITKRD